MGLWRTKQVSFTPRSYNIFFVFANLFTHRLFFSYLCNIEPLKKDKRMNQDVIKKASEIIASKANYIGGGMEGYAVLALIDENGYPSASALTIAKADGVNWLTFATSPDSNKAKRIAKNTRASVCIASSSYNITLVGTIEVVDDINAKKETWFEPMSHMWSGPEDPNFYLIRFKTERYNIFVVEGENVLEDVGTL